MTSPLFFPAAADFRTWLEENHEGESELWVGYYKVATGKPSLTWPESVDQALCFGWIDGIRKRIDDESYKIRFTPRKPGSIWSAVNIEKMEALKKDGLVSPAGLAAYDKRTVERSKIYAYERKTVEMSAEFEDRIRGNAKAWQYWEQLAPYAKKASTHWVMSAKREETRQRRLKILIASSEQGLKIPGLRR